MKINEAKTLAQFGITLGDTVVEEINVEEGYATFTLAHKKQFNIDIASEDIIYDSPYAELVELMNIVGTGGDEMTLSEWNQLVGATLGKINEHPGLIDVLFAYNAEVCDAIS